MQCPESIRRILLAAVIAALILLQFLFWDALRSTQAGITYRHPVRLDFTGSKYLTIHIYGSGDYEVVGVEEVPIDD